MLPTRQDEVLGKENSAISNQWPDTNDCILLDKQIAAITNDISNVDDKNYFQYNRRSGVFGSIDDEINKQLRKAYRGSLEKLLLEKNNKVVKLDCRNKIEIKRQEESAALFNNQATKSDVSVLTTTKNKQIAYAVVGGVVLLTTLYLLSRK